MKQFNSSELRLLERHYKKFKIFGKTFYFWNTSPIDVLEHLKELQQEDIIHKTKFPNDIVWVKLNKKVISAKKLRQDRENYLTNFYKRR